MQDFSKPVSYAVTKTAKTAINIQNIPLKSCSFYAFDARGKSNNVMYN